MGTVKPMCCTGKLVPSTSFRYKRKAAKKKFLKFEILFFKIAVGTRLNVWLRCSRVGMEVEDVETSSFVCT